MEASEVIGQYLRANFQVQAVNYPGGPVAKTFAIGEPVGRVESWIENNGTVFWQIEGTNLYVPHATNRYELFNAPPADISGGTSNQTPPASTNPNPDAPAPGNNQASWFSRNKKPVFIGLSILTVTAIIVFAPKPTA